MRGQAYKLNGWPNEVIGFNDRLVIETCPRCHIPHGIPEEMRNRALEFNSAAYPNNHVSVYCPNGHSWSYSGKTEEQKRIERLERSLQQADKDNDRLRSQRDVAKRQAAARKGQLTKMRNRFAAGVCPVGSCHANLGDRVRDHIATEHPEFRMADIESV